jgi:transposase
MINPDRFHVTFKMLKRQMLGRAKLDLLRKRVLLAA